MTQKSLWGDIPAVDDLVTPTWVLREQASALSEATKGVLQGGVTVSQDGSGFVLDLYIRAPALDNYQYAVLRAAHGLYLYPVRVIDSSEPNSVYWCENQDGFEQVLGDILSSDRVRRAVRSLIAQSRQTGR